MKRYLLLFLLLLPLCSAAQERTFDTFYESYAGREGCRSVLLGRKMMQIMRRDADPQLSRLLDGIRDIRILTVPAPAAEFVSEARNVAASERYELISRTDGEGQSTSFHFIDGGREGTSELLMLSFGEKELLVLDIRGRFDVRDISQLARLRPQQP